MKLGRTKKLKIFKKKIKFRKLEFIYEKNACMYLFLKVNKNKLKINKFLVFIHV